MNTTDNFCELCNVTDMTSHHETYSRRVHAVILTTIIASVAWLLFANAAIVACFITNRKKAWPVFEAQIFCLSLSDLFVGLVALPWIIIPIAKPGDLAVSYVWCSTMLYMLVCSQCGSLYHMLTICVHRCFRIQMSKTIAVPQRNRKAPFCFALLAWTISFVVCSLPFTLWTNIDGIMYSCLMQEVFVDSTKAMGFFSVILFIPQALTNVLYVIACLRMRCIWRRVFPNNTETSTVQSTASTLPSSGYSRANIRLQRRFMGTIGIVMLLFNICTLPVVCLAFLENKYHVTTRDFRYAACACFILNSALNPFIYAFRSSWLKNSLRRLVSNFCDCFVCL